jgi:tetratricopeptide (TPR) repeat protein
VAALTKDDAKANERAIIDLGLKHFLVTPFTSLLVLENEAMYARFDVHRPAKDRWARYDAAAKIPVRYEPIRGIEPAPGTHLVRVPRPKLNGGNTTILDATVEFASQQARHFQSSAIRTRGFGTGAGFGRNSANVWGGSAGEAFGIGGLGLIGSGRGGGGTGEGLIGLGNLANAEASRAPLMPSGATVLKESAEARPMSTFTLSSKLADGPTTWSTQATTAASQSGILGNLGGRGKSARTRGGGWGGLHAGWATSIWPAGFHYSRDPAFDDLSEWVPALFEDDFDLAREALLENAAKQSDGSITPEARARIESIRGRLTRTRYVDASDGRAELLVDEHGHFQIRSLRGKHLDERIIYDGEDLRAEYDALGLVVRRRVGVTEPALLWQHTPWVMPSADALAHWYRVSLSKDGDLVLAHTATNTKRILRVEENRVVAMELVEAGERRTLIEMKHGPNKLTIEGPSGTRELETQSAAEEARGVADSTWTLVEMPLRDDQHWSTQLDSHLPGSQAWRHAQEQRLAGYAALNRGDLQWPILTELAEHDGALHRGALALASAAARQGNDAEWKRVIASTGDPGPIGEYLLASRELHLRNRSSKLAEFAGQQQGTTAGMLAAHRELLHRIEQGRKTSEIATDLAEHLARYDDPVMAFLLAERFSAHHQWRDARATARVWTALADRFPRWAVLSHHRVGQAYYNRGKGKRAAEAFEKMLEVAIERREAPIMDWSVRSATQSAGTGSWLRMWSRFRSAALASEDATLLTSFILQSISMGEQRDLRIAVRKLHGLDGELALGDGLRIHDALIGQGMDAEALPILAALLERHPDELALLLRSSSLAERQGRLSDAIALHERAMEMALEPGSDSAGLDLHGLRAAYGRLFELKKRLFMATSSTDDEAAARPESALATIREWRRFDPDNPEIDQRAAQLFYELEFDEEAWRELSSIVERRPAEGQSHSTVAGELERMGRFDEAEAVWERAIAVEPTNPRWLLGSAQNALSRGDQDAAAGRLREIERGSWQDRFSNTVWEARTLSSSLKGE